MNWKLFPGSTEYKFDFGLAQEVIFDDDPTSISFQVLCDAEYDTRGVGFGPVDLTSITNRTHFTNDVTTGFTAQTLVQTVTEEPLFVSEMIHPLSRGVFASSQNLQAAGPDHLSQLVECRIPDLASFNTSTHPQLVDGDGGLYNRDPMTPHKMPTLFHVNANGEWFFRDVVFKFQGNRTIFVLFNDTQGAGQTATTVYYFHTKDAVDYVQRSRDSGVGKEWGFAVCTKVQMYKFGGDPATKGDFATVIGNCLANNKTTCSFLYMGKDYQTQCFENEHLQSVLAESDQYGPIFHSQKRISQHLCAPIINPNARIGCGAPLNYETMHLPPEMRDFRLELRDVNFSFLPGAAKMEDLVLYNFNGGNQVVASQPSMLHLPQFREFKTTQVKDDGQFDFEMFSPYGMPSYMVVFARDTDMSRDHMIQPLIKQLSIMCTTTMKKSNTILNANVHQLYHITQRNVNPRARYNRHTFNSRQTILLSAEDVGLMGLHVGEYQREKRATFRFHGTVDQKSRITAVLIYNNRALHVFGKQLRVVRLTEKNLQE